MFQFTKAFDYVLLKVVFLLGVFDIVVFLFQKSCNVSHLFFGFLLTFRFLDGDSVVESALVIYSL